MVIPKPLCHCRVCQEARRLGPPYERTGPSAFLHDLDLLIDTPAEAARQLNQCGIKSVKKLIFTHLDPDHVEGFRVVEQITLDFRSWSAYPHKQIELLLPEALNRHISDLSTWYGPSIDFYESRGFIKRKVISETVEFENIKISAFEINRGSRPSFVYCFRQGQNRIVYAPCDVKPFPENRAELHGADLLVIQPGIFEEGLKHDFTYPDRHISRTTLYTFQETLELAARIEARQVVFVHLEEYWNRGFNDYARLESNYHHVTFAQDGLELTV